MLKLIKKYPITLIGLIALGYNIVISLLQFQYDEPGIREWLVAIAIWNPVVRFADHFIFNIPSPYHTILLVIIIPVMGFLLDVLFREIWPILQPIKRWIYSTVFVVLVCSCFFLYEESFFLKNNVHHFAEMSGWQKASKDYKSGILRLYKIEYIGYDGKSKKINPSGEFEGQLEIYYESFISFPIFDRPDKYGLEVWVEAYNHKMKELVKSADLQH